MVRILLTALSFLGILNTYPQTAQFENYCTRIGLFDDKELNLFTSKMFRIRTSTLEGEKFPDKYTIPFAIGNVAGWNEVNYKEEEDDEYKYIITNDLGIRMNKRDKTWTVWTSDFEKQIHPSDGPVYGIFKNEYTLFDAASAFNEKNNNSRYAHWFYNPQTENYVDTYLAEEHLLDQYFIYGPDYRSLFFQFNQLVGAEPLLPKKAYGFFQTQHLACNGTQTELMDVARKLREEDIPVDNLIIDFEWGDGCDRYKEVIWGSRLDWSNNYEKPLPPERMLEVLDSMHYDVMLIRHNAPNFKNRSNQGWTEAISKDEIWWEKYWKRMDEGVDGTWQDTRQNDITDSYIWQTTQKRLGTQRRVLFLGCRKMQSVNPWDFRFSTIPVNQIIGSRRYPFDWTGDASFSWNELKWQIKAITNTHGAMKGVSYISSDAVGANWKIQARWNQFADFTAISRSHHPKPWSGNTDTKNFESKIRISGRDTVNIKEESALQENRSTAIESIRKHRKIRYRLIPYIYSHAIENYLTGMPITRPMILAFADDYLCNADNWPYQYMFGNSLLVAPVYGDFNSMEIYLPRGFNWIDFWSNEVYSGGGVINYNTSDINKLPLFIKAGSIVPMRQDMNWIDPQVPDDLIFEIYPSDSISTYTFYEDDDVSTKYQVGAYGKTDVTYTRLAKSSKLVISKTVGEYHKKPLKRIIEIRVNLIDDPPSEIICNDTILSKETFRSDKSNIWTYDNSTNSIVMWVNVNTQRNTEVVIKF